MKKVRFICRGLIQRNRATLWNKWAVAITAIASVLHKLKQTLHWKTLANTSLSPQTVKSWKTSQTCVHLRLRGLLKWSSSETRLLAKTEHIRAMAEYTCCVSWCLKRPHVHKVIVITMGVTHVMYSRKVDIIAYFLSTFKTFNPLQSKLNLTVYCPALCYCCHCLSQIVLIWCQSFSTNTNMSYMS